jgi:hypothetical protein
LNELFKKAVFWGDLWGWIMAPTESCYLIANEVPLAEFHLKPHYPKDKTSAEIDLLTMALGITSGITINDRVVVTCAHSFYLSFTRSEEDLTNIAREICKTNGINYPSRRFRILAAAGPLIYSNGINSDTDVALSESGSSLCTLLDNLDGPKFLGIDALLPCGHSPDGPIGYDWIMSALQEIAERTNTAIVALHSQENA